MAKLAKGFYVVAPIQSTNGLIKKVESLQKALRVDFPVLDGQTEGSKKKGTPVPMSGNKFLHYQKGGLATRGKIARALDSIMMMLGELAVKTEVVKQVPEAKSNVVPMEKPKRKRTRRSA